MPTLYSFQFCGLAEATDEQLISHVQEFAQNQQRGEAASDEQEKLTMRAFELLQKRHHEPLSAFIGSKMKNSDSADDVVAKTWTSVWLSAPQFRGTATFKSWLYSIAYNELRDQVKRENRKTWGINACAFGLEEEIENWMESRPSENPLPEDGFCDASDMEHRKAQVALALNQLEEPYRTILLLRLKYGKTLKEIGEWLHQEGLTATLLSTTQVDHRYQKAYKQVLHAVQS